MGLEIRRNASGTITGHFFGAYTDQSGKRVCVPLKTKIGDTPPASLRDTGTPAFEASRAAALAELEALKEEARHKGRADHLTERLIESKTGRAVEYVKLADLAERWRGLGREAKPGAAWLAWNDTVFNRFAAAVPCQYLHEVTPEQAAAYVETLRRDFARKTVKVAAGLLRSAFSRLLPLGTQNPFAAGIARKGSDEDGDTVHRRPFTAPELTALFEAARPDPFLFPLVVTAACTGLRRGDVCRLKWSAVDLRAGVVAVKTSKTGAAVEIPIFETLREVLESALADRRAGAVYVFPNAARMVAENADGLTWRFKKLVASIMPDQDAAEEAAEPVQCVGRVDLAQVLPEVCAAVGAAVEGPRRERMLETLRLYAEGAGVRAIEKRTGRARSVVSLDLHRAEEISGRRFMPEAVKGGGVKARIDRVTRGASAAGRARRASVLDWHSLRVTWVTMALAAGVPMEVARLVTGHKTVEVVLRHYFKPGRDHLRAVLGDKLPEVLTGARAKSAKQLTQGGAADVAGLAAQLKTLSAADRRKLAKLLK